MSPEEKREVKEKFKKFVERKREAAEVMISLVDYICVFVRQLLCMYGFSSPTTHIMANFIFNKVSHAHIHRFSIRGVYHILNRNIPLKCIYDDVDQVKI